MEVKQNSKKVIANATNQLSNLVVAKNLQPLVNQSNVNKIPPTQISLKKKVVEGRMFIKNSTISDDPHIKNMLNLNKPTFGDVWNVYVSKMDSLKYFYVQNTDHLEYIETICSSLRLDENDSITSKNLPKVGSLIAACDESGSWYRAKVIRKKNLELFACFIDFSDDVVMVTDFKNLPAEHINIKPLAHRCYFKNGLNHDEKLFDSDTFYIIKRFFNINAVECIFSNSTEPYSVTLSHNGKNFLDIISELVWEGIIPDLIDDPIHNEKHKLLNKIFSVKKPVTVSIVEPIISTEHFYVETLVTNEMSKKIRIEIEKNKKRTSVSDPKEGKIVIAKNPQDMKFYRARVLLKYKDCEYYKCFLIDCGKFEICSELFEPSNYLCTVPPVKIHCSLNVSIKYNVDILKSMTLAFVDEITVCSDDLKIMKVIEIGSPCIVDLEIAGLKTSDVIMPREVRVLNITNLNYFKVRLFTKNMNKIVSVLKNTKRAPTVPDPILLKIYMCLYDNQFKRVKFMGSKGSGFDVTFVDQFPKPIIVGELYELPKSIQNLETMDIHCCFQSFAQIYSYKKFIEICKNSETKFMMVIIKNDHLNGHITKLYLNNVDVETMIC